MILFGPMRAYSCPIFPPRAIIQNFDSPRSYFRYCHRREREATYCNSMEPSGMDSTLPHSTDSRERLLDVYWTREQSSKAS